MSRRGINNNFTPTRAPTPPPPPSPPRRGSSNNFFPIRRLPSRRPPPPSPPPPPWTRHPWQPFEVPSQNGRGDFLDPWIPIEFPSFPIAHRQGHFILINEMPRIDPNPWPRQAIPEFPVAQEAESRLTKEEQNKALKKLRKEKYNPTPKTTPKAMTRRLGLYYRDKGITHGREKIREDDEDDGGKRCAVCLDDFEAGQLTMLTPCNHMFHEECIVPWVKSHGQCPVCRFAICERIGERSNSRNNNNNRTAQDLFAAELTAIVRDMEEAMTLAREMH